MNGGGDDTQAMGKTYPQRRLTNPRVIMGRARRKMQCAKLRDKQIQA